MSSGIVICSKCKREVHQMKAWYHCEDKTPRCDGATSIYPNTKADIVGEWCGADGPWVDYVDEHGYD